MKQDTGKQSKKATTVVAVNKYAGYDQYIAVDWSQQNMAIARMTSKTDRMKVLNQPTDLAALKHYLKQQPGKRIMTIEESTPAQWLYVELHDYVDRIIICDPYKNKLLSDGPKNDPIDAAKLCELLKNGQIKEVYHTTDRIYELRKYVSAYDDMIKRGVRMKNQRAGFLGQIGKSKKEKAGTDGDTAAGFVLKELEYLIDQNEQSQKAFENKFEQLCKADIRLRNLKSIPGIGIIFAVKILALTINPERFENAGKYLAYCGLAKHLKDSGGKTYGKRNPRYSRALKAVYKSAACMVSSGKGPLRGYYEHSLQKGMVDFNARHALARYIARLAYGILKDNKPYDPYRWQKTARQEKTKVPGRPILSRIKKQQGLS